VPPSKKNSIIDLDSNLIFPLFRYNNTNQSASRRNSDEGTIHERTPLVFPALSKVDTCSSILTVADNYLSTQVTHNKSSFTQSIFNSINILIGVGILALPLGFKVSLNTSRWIPPIFKLII
jgi:hypothetical protein